MALTTYYNGTGSTGVTVELIAHGNNSVGIASILLTNIHAAADATVTLFIQDDPASGTTSTYKIISTVAIPSDTALLLDDSSMLTFDNSEAGYGLYITVGSSDTVDVFINNVS